MGDNYEAFTAENDRLIDKLSEEKAFYRSKAKILSKTDIIPDSLYIEKDVKRGLRNANGTGVIVGLTKVGDVIGYDFDEQGNKIAIDGKLYYRGYDVEDLFNNCVKENRFGFEEVTYLLLFGELPSKEELSEFTKLLGAKRELPKGFARDMILTAPSKSIMNKLARSVLAMYSYDDNPDDTSIENVLRQSISLIGHFPALIAYGFQAKRSSFDNESLHLHNPIPELSTAENILRMIRPTGEYTDIEAKLLDLSLILHAEHGGGNNSTFTTHLVSSSGTDTYSAISAAVGSLKGPRHGGANIAVINMMHDLVHHVKDITNEAQVEDYLVKVLKGDANDRSGLIYGLGHAIYTISDPRATLLKSMARKLAESKGLEDSFHLYEFIENRGASLYKEVKGIDKPMPANVDLYSGFVYRALNIPVDIATPLFATARLSGWCAHRLEEIITGRRLMRPAYNGVQPYLEYVPIAKR
ncbi:citrate/2-methylcitrate synthase [Aminipila luticellarii]|uniref:Citrate synthase n=1 Tax=Aminipila luticellarii TaxID=2507160 RepID=A0A410PX64_9FIRM|nr:citrate/2-methylcitrate synthase [Aminipila luticellarii]QAT43495.1 citrate/2-methylcitrate synthase [Aminipila luticellarii]